MKRILTPVLAFVAVCAFTVMVFAQTPAADSQKAAPATKAQTKAPAMKATTKPAAAKSLTFSGRVVSVDTVAMTVVVKGKKAEETFNVEPGTKVKVAGKTAKLADLKKDAWVKVMYKMKDGRRTATAIM